LLHVLQATALTAQSYRKVVTTARRDKKAGTGPKGLTEEQKQEIRYDCIIYLYAKITCGNTVRCNEFLGVF